MVRRHELTDQAWAEIAPLLPVNGRPPPGAERDLVGAFDRGALAGPARALWPWQTCYERFRRWQADGTWQRLLAHAQDPLRCGG